MTYSAHPVATPPPAAQHLRRAAAIAFALLLSGYLIFNRPFAQLGWPPVYIGEMVLGLSLFAALFDFNAVFIEPVKRSRTMQLVALFMLYGAVRIFFDAQSAGLNAARDGVICLYAVAAFLGPWLFRWTGGDLVLRVLFCVPTFAMLYAFGIVEGDWSAPAAVKVDFLSISAAVAFSVSVIEFANERKSLRCIGPLFLSLLSLVTLYELPTRTLWAAPFATLFLALLTVEFSRRKAMLLAAGVALCASAVFAVAWSRPAARDKIEAIVHPDESRFQTREGQRAAHSVQWRLAFWKRCAEVTAARAPVFGLGFGSNLTDLLRDTPQWPMFEDSQDATKYGAPNRHPHSAHVTVFARLGALGLLLWLTLLSTVFFHGVKNCRQLRAVGNAVSPEYFAAAQARFAFELTLLSLWLTYLLAMTFGVVLENPFGGIWFWTVTGLLVKGTPVDSVTKKGI